MARVNSGRPKKKLLCSPKKPKKKIKQKPEPQLSIGKKYAAKKKQRLLKQAGVGSDLWPLAARRKGQWKVQRPRLSPMKRPKEKSKDQGKSPISRNSSKHNAKSYGKKLAQSEN